MRRLPLTLLVCAFVLAFMPAPAHAQIWQWIDELSGPGPFQGPAFEWKLVCFGDRTDTTRDGVEAVLGILGPGCLARPVPPRERRGSVNLGFGALKADRNRLKYADRGDQDHDVALTLLEPSVWWSPAMWVDTGTGGGIMWFSGRAFPTFRRVFFEPIRVNLKLLTLIARGRSENPPEWLDFLSIRASAIIIPRSFSADDFGAIPGSFATSREVLQSYAVAVDFEPIVRYLRRDRQRRAAP